jgi:hypothetical protein
MEPPDPENHATPGVAARGERETITGQEIKKIVQLVPNATIVDGHLELLDAAAISPDVAHAAGVRSVTTIDEIPEEHRWCKSGARDRVPVPVAGRRHRRAVPARRACGDQRRSLERSTCSRRTARNGLNVHPDAWPHRLTTARPHRRSWREPNSVSPQSPLLLISTSRSSEWPAATAGHLAVHRSQTSTLDPVGRAATWW